MVTGRRGLAGGAAAAAGLALAGAARAQGAPPLKIGVLNEAFAAGNPSVCPLLKG